LAKALSCRFRKTHRGVRAGARAFAQRACGLAQQGGGLPGYGLIDAIIDDYFGVLSQFTEHVERTDQLLLHGREQGVLHKVQRLKHDCLKLRRSILPCVKSCSP
jgi:magnesium transporter